MHPKCFKNSVGKSTWGPERLDGKLKPSSIILLEHTMNSDTRAQVAYQGIRRAFLRCQLTGYVLPEENYESWKTLKITFSKVELFGE